MTHSSHPSPVLSDSIANFVQDESRIFSNHKSFRGNILLLLWDLGKSLRVEKNCTRKKTQKPEQATSISLAHYFPRCCHKIICGEVLVSASSVSLHSLAPVNFTLSEEFFSFCSSISISKQQRTFGNMAGPSFSLYINPLVSKEKCCETCSQSFLLFHAVWREN